MAKLTNVESDEVVAAKRMNWRARTLLIGGVVGALIGLGSAFILIQNAEKHGGEVKVTTGDGVRLGVLVMGVLRQVASLGSGD